MDGAAAFPFATIYRLIRQRAARGVRGSSGADGRPYVTEICAGRIRVKTAPVETGISLHEIAFTPVLRSQGSDEQIAYWLPKVIHFTFT